MNDFVPRFRSAPALPSRRARMVNDRLVLPPRVPHRTLREYLPEQLIARCQTFGARLSAANQLNAGSQRKAIAPCPSHRDHEGKKTNPTDPRAFITL